MLRVIVVDNERLWRETFADELREELAEKYPRASADIRLFESTDKLLAFYESGSFAPHVCVLDVDFGRGGETAGYKILLPALLGLKYTRAIPPEARTFFVSGQDSVLRDEAELSSRAEFEVEALLPKGQIMSTGFLVHIERLVSEGKLPAEVIGGGR